MESFREELGTVEGGVGNADMGSLIFGVMYCDMPGVRAWYGLSSGSNAYLRVNVISRYGLIVGTWTQDAPL